jgi:hypothetical protein
LYDSRICLVDVQASAIYFANAPSQPSREGILGKPKEEIGDQNGFEYMYLNGLMKEYAQAEGVSAGFGVDSESASDLLHEIGLSEMAECWEKV